MALKKTNKRPMNKGGVNTDPSLRVKLKKKKVSSDTLVSKPKTMQLTIGSDDPMPVKKKKKKLDADGNPIKKKKPKDDIEDVEFIDLPKKKKSKKAERERTETGLAIFGRAKERAVTLSKSKGRVSGGTILGENAEEIQQLLNSGDNDRAMPMIQTMLMRTVMDLIPYAEAQIRNTEGAKGVYQINSLISSVREIMADIQMSQDRSAIGHMIAETIMRPAFMDMAMQTMNLYTEILQDARLILTPEAYNRFEKNVKKHRDSQGEFYNASFKLIRDGILQALE